jgi:hypothetical protein
MAEYRTYWCINHDKKYVQCCRKKTEAKTGSPREQLSLCPECYDAYDKERYAEKKKK